MASDDRYVHVSPRDFINGPYINCPKCGKDSFGVLMVCERHYCRRCRECFYPRGHEQPAVYPLPELRKKIIYLDQFAISNMMHALNPETPAHQKGRIDPFWKTLFEKIDSLCKLQLMVCPDSDFHRHESMLSSFYQPLKTMYELLSQGVTFFDHDTIHRFQIIEQLHEWLGDHDFKKLTVHDVTHGNINAWRDRFMFSIGNFQIPGLVEEIRNAREQIIENIEPIFKRLQAETDRDFNHWFEEEKKGHATGLCERFDRILKRFAAASLGVGPFDPWDLTDFSTVTMLSIVKIIKCHGIEESEAYPKLFEFLRSGTFESAAHIKISAMLWAALARKAAAGRKRLPNRGFSTDVQMISALLPYCDAMFVDNECRGYLTEEPLCQLEYGTNVFSYNTKEAFMEYLDSIRSDASAAHIAKVHEVYGEDWEKPFTELYEN